MRAEAEGDDTFTAFHTDGAALSTAGLEKMAPGSVAQAGVGRYTLEIEVDDVDAEFDRLGQFDLSGSHETAQDGHTVDIGRFASVVGPALPRGVGAAWRKRPLLQRLWIPLAQRGKEPERPHSVLFLCC